MGRIGTAVLWLALGSCSRYVDGSVRNPIWPSGGGPDGCIDGWKRIGEHCYLECHRDSDCFAGEACVCRNSADCGVPFAANYVDGALQDVCTRKFTHHDGGAQSERGAHVVQDMGDYPVPLQLQNF